MDLNEFARNIDWDTMPGRFKVGDVEIWKGGEGRIWYKLPDQQMQLLTQQEMKQNTVEMIRIPFWNWVFRGMLDKLIEWIDFREAHPEYLKVEPPEE